MKRTVFFIKIQQHKFCYQGVLLRKILFFEIDCIPKTLKMSISNPLIYLGGRDIIGNFKAINPIQSEMGTI